MSDKKDIFGVFREERGYEPSPPPRAWQRIERRLDRPSRRHTQGKLPVLALAAALLLLALIGIAFWMSTEEVPKRLLNTSPMPLAAERLPVDEEATAGLSYRARQAEQQRQQAINEGQRGRKLVLTSQSDAQDSSLDQFGWIAGEWQSGYGQQARTTVWQPIGQHAWQGITRSATSNETLAEMRIFQTGAKVQFVLLEEGQAQKRYTLAYVSPKEAVFERAGEDRPERVHLSRSAPGQLLIAYSGSAMDSLRLQSSEGGW